MSLEKIDLNKGLSRQELKELFQAKIRSIVSSDTVISPDDMQQLENKLGGVEQVATLLQKGIDYLGEKPHSRRTFLKVAGLGLVTLLYALSNQNCATTSVREVREESVVYPPLPRHKVQPPKNGCYIGFHSNANLDYYKNLIGKKPKIIIPGSFRMDCRTDFLTELVEAISSHGAIPFVYKTLTIAIPTYGFGNLVGNKEFKKDLMKYARNIVKFGKPIFVCTMRELNCTYDKNLYPWREQPTTAKKVWKHMWQVFEDQGANEYATWVWEVYCPEGYNHDPNIIDNPERYYPGDKYVDWIAFSAYNRKEHSSTNRSFSSLVGATYRQMRRNHPTKPIMMAEFGKFSGSDQARWLEKAFETIKLWKGMKAAIYWPISDLYIGPTNDSSLTGESIEVYKKIMKDPYFIGIK